MLRAAREEEIDKKKQQITTYCCRRVHPHAAAHHSRHPHFPAVGWQGPELVLYPGNVVVLVVGCPATFTSLAALREGIKEPARIMATPRMGERFVREADL